MSAGPQSGTVGLGLGGNFYGNNGVAMTGPANLTINGPAVGGAAGNRTTHILFERQIHGFITMSKVLAEARSAVALCGAALREALSPGA